MNVVFKSVLILLQLSMVLGSLQAEDGGRAGFAVRMMHRDHVESSFHVSTSPSYRMRAAVGRSVQRRQSFRRVLQEAQKGSFQSVVSRGINTDGEYVASIKLGRPGVEFNSVLLDTGSDLTWVGCKTCSRCDKLMGPFFDPNISTTFRMASCSDNLCHELYDLNDSKCRRTDICGYSYGYADGSISTGTFAFESLTFSGADGVSKEFTNFGFGCANATLPSESWAGANGVLGMGRGFLSLPSQLGPLVDKKFSYCLVSSEEALNHSSYLIIGDSGIPKDPKNILYTPLVTNKATGSTSFYYVGLQGISVGETKLGIPLSTFALDWRGNGGTIIDSGTSVTYIAKLAYDALVARLKIEVKHRLLKQPNFDSHGLGLCFRVGKEENLTLPPITFHFGGGADVVLPPSNTFYRVDDQGTYCLAMLPSEDEEGPSTIYGNIQQQNFEIIFDLHAQRIGFLQRRCS